MKIRHYLKIDFTSDQKQSEKQLKHKEIFFTFKTTDMAKDLTDMLLKEEVYLYHYFEEVMIRVDKNFNFFKKVKGKTEIRIDATSDIAIQALMGEDIKTKEEYDAF